MGLFTATRHVARIELIDIDELVARGIRCLLIDRDNTCVPRDSHTAPPAVVQWFDRARAAGLSLCLVSNNFHTTDVSRNAAELDVDFIDHAMKPAPVALWAALERVGVSREQAMLVGDQVFTDVVAGNLAGIDTILVRPQCSSDLWYTKPMRVAENRILADCVFEGE